MDVIKNYAIYIDDSPVYVTMIERAFWDKLEELTNQHPDKKVTWTIWYD